MNLIRSFASDIGHRLMAEFSDMHVVIEGARDEGGQALFETAVEKALAGQIPAGGKLGLCAIIFQPEGAPESVMNRGLSFKLTSRVRIIESKALNDGPQGTGIAAADRLADAMLLLQCWQPRPGKTATIVTFERLTVKDEPDLEVWEFELAVQDAGKGRERCNVVTFGGTSTALSMTCSTSGAQIWFTTDGTLPAAGINGTLYTTPVDVHDAAVVRAVAFKSGLSAGDGAWYEV